MALKIKDRVKIQNKPHSQLVFSSERPVGLKKEG